MRDLEPGLHLVLGATPDRVFVLDRQHAVEAAFVERIDQGRPVHGAEAMDLIRDGGSTVTQDNVDDFYDLGF